LDLKVRNNSDHQTDIINDFIDPKNSKNRILHKIVGQTITMIISNMVDGGHFGFMAFTELAHTFARGMGVYFLFNFHTNSIKDKSTEKRTYALHGHGCVVNDPTNRDSSNTLDVTYR
jgi:UDP-2,3-diacylglucosamine pyrophosphatase LpxH